MHQFFSRLLIGYLIVIFDLKIVIDWLPDLIGFIIVAFAIRTYANSKYSKTAILLCWLAGFLSIFEMPVLQGIFSRYPQEFWMSFEFIVSFVQLIVYYYIFGICLSFVEQTPHIDYTKRIKNWLVGSLWFLMTANYILIHTDSVVFSIIFVIAGIVSLVGIVMFIVYCNKMMRYGKMIESDESTSSNLNWELGREHK